MGDFLMHYIYIYTNKLNGKKYIGQTTKTLNERAGSNFKNYEESWKFYTALCKDGIDAFNREIVYQTEDSGLANAKEIELIKKYSSQNDDFGYNIQPGGSLFIMNDIIKAKIGIAVKNSEKYQKNNFKAHAKPIVAVSLVDASYQYFDSATEAADVLNLSRGNISAICRGKGRAISLAGYLFRFKTNFDPDKVNSYITAYKERQSKRYSNERNEKLKRSLQQKYARDTSKFDSIRKKVICIETNEIFKSLKDAALAKNIKAASNIREVCNGKRVTAGNYHWKFLSSTTIPDECKGVEPKT